MKPVAFLNEQRNSNAMTIVNLYRHFTRFDLPRENMAVVGGEREVEYKVSDLLNFILQ